MTQVFQHVTHPEAVKVFLNLTYLPVLAALMAREWTVSALAAHLGLAVNATHHRVRRLVAVGLAQEIRLEARRGRPLRHYRAPPALLVPYHCTPLDTLEDLIGLHEDSFQVAFQRAVVRAGLALVENRNDIGLRLYLDGEEVVSDITPTAGAFSFRDLLRPDAPALLANRGLLHLTREDAKALQTELSEVLTRYLQKTGPEPYLFRVGLAPDLPGGAG
ncbi:winged helix-turn-helix domain-containing protein [Deinococcus multiflagellatus]|uniref:Winged helix-turn-helix domain-containing protein n=1 Tax=Deinococcus multiflagellatus TaxID=1656887 RepID=A0ABW1ZK36_9DEIO|nr:winged helix-turn-helix domain-containing protein [Deinococcus multiflagellatus]MBZ9713355.1 winged helix-turn-helix domain-containing protein [Deinococcus multiflagellatus]